MRIQHFDVRVMVLNATFNNISAISWWLVLLVEENRVQDKTTNLSPDTDKLYHIMLYRVHLTISGFWFVLWCLANVTFNNIAVISWRSVLLVEETGIPRENHWPVASHWETLSHNVLSRYKYTSPWTGFELTTLVVIGTDCTGSCKSNYHTITTTTVLTF